MRIRILKLIVLIILMPASVYAGGVSPYLPLNTSPEIERQIERVMLIAGRPVMTRPIAVAEVLEALHEARDKDEGLCEQVETYLMRYMHDVGMTRLSAEVSVSTGDSDQVIPNGHGRNIDSSWEVSGEAYYRLGQYALISLGGIAYDGRATPTGSMLSVGMDYAQFDIGYRDHWLSPFTDSSMLISTEAPTMPSITMSNYRPITGLGLHYELFLAEMSESDRIAYQDRYTTGKPRLAGVHLHAEPVAGYAFSVNRQFQFGGGERRNDGLSDFIHAFVNGSEYDLSGPSLTYDQEFGNQQASLASRILFPGEQPFAVYFEYAGEDFSRTDSVYLGSSSFSLGVDIPFLWNRFDLTYESTEWQNAWYAHHLYGDGLRNYNAVVGHWFGDQREFNDTAGGMSHMLRMGWQTDNCAYLQVVYRTLKNESYTTAAYKRMHGLGINYSWPWHGQTMGLGLYSGRDVFGDSYARLSVSVNFAQKWQQDRAEIISTAADQDDETEFLLDTGTTYVHLDSNLEDSDGEFRYQGVNCFNMHYGIGAMHAVSDHSDLGVRVEWERIEENNLYSMRLMDYRYRISDYFAVNGFFGVGCYELDAPAYGYYWGAGSTFLDLIGKCDLCVDIRWHSQMSRSRLNANETSSTRVFFNLRSLSVYLSRSF